MVQLYSNEKPRQVVISYINILAKKMIQSFGNYATAQLRRLQNALVRDSYPQPVKEQHILNSIEAQMHHFMDEEINLKHFLCVILNLFIQR